MTKPEAIETLMETITQPDFTPEVFTFYESGQYVTAGTGPCLPGVKLDSPSFEVLKELNR